MSEVASWSGKIASKHRARAERRNRTRGDRRPLARDPARHRRGRARTEDPGWRADRGGCRSRRRPTRILPATDVQFDGGMSARGARPSARSRRTPRKPERTRDGRAVRLLANAGTRAEVDAALAAGADGIGLLRTELAFLHASEWPDEASHRAALAPLLAPLAHRIATVRTLDFGGDKTPPFLAGTDATNPFGSTRHPPGARVARGRRAATPGAARGRGRRGGQDPDPDGAMRPARSTPCVRSQTPRDEIPSHGAPDPLVGAMIEIPAVTNAAAIARRCDFLSVGTNDLIQYTLATDRQDPPPRYAPLHTTPAVLRLIARAVTKRAERGSPSMSAVRRRATRRRCRF